MEFDAFENLARIGFIIPFMIVLGFFLPMFASIVLTWIENTPKEVEYVIIETDDE